jgi:hypothetical protein
MMRFLRKHRNTLMIVIAVLAIPFVFYFNKTDFSAKGPDDFATVYNRKITMVEAQRSARLYGMAELLGMDTLAQGLGGGGNDKNKSAMYFVLNLSILQHETAQLGIQPTQSELTDFVRNLRAFRGASGFDSNKYREFTENILPANGFTDAQIEELATYALSFNRIKELVAVGVSLPDSESKENYELQNGKLFVQAVRIHGGDFAKDIKVTDEDVQKYFEASKKEFMTEEKRKVEFVALALTDEQKKLTGKERIDVLQKLADRANEFTQALGEKGADFHKVATKFQLPVKATGEFTAAAADPQLKSDPQLSTGAFQLTAQEPNSEAVQTPDGFYVLHLASVVEARPLTLEEAKGKIVDAIKNTRMREMAMNKGRSVAQELRESLTTGTPLPSALEKAKVKAEKIPPFTLKEAFDQSNVIKSEPEAKAGSEPKNNRPKDFNTIANAAAQVQPGEVSEFVPSEDGGMLVFVEKREPPDEAKYREDKAAFDERILRNKREVAFAEWLRDRQRDAGLISVSPEPTAPARSAAPPSAPAPPPPRKS